MSSRGTIKELSSSFIASYNNNKPRTGTGRTPLDKFLQIDCKSGKFDIRDAHFYFDHMLSMRPSPPISCFNALLGALAKKKQYSLAISFYKTQSVSGILVLSSDLVTLNILVNCYSRMKLGTDAFSAFVLLFKNGHRPDIITYNSLVKGLCLEGKVDEVVGLLPKMIRLGCAPNVFTYSTIIDGLCKNGNVAAALQLYRQLVHCKEGTSREEQTLSFNMMDDSCIEWPISDMKGKGDRISLDIVSYNCLIDGLGRSGMEEEARSVFVEMVGNDVHPNSATFKHSYKFSMQERRSRARDGAFGNDDLKRRVA